MLKVTPKKMAEKSSEHQHDGFKKKDKGDFRHLAAEKWRFSTPGKLLCPAEGECGLEIALAKTRARTINQLSLSKRPDNKFRSHSHMQHLGCAGREGSYLLQV
jgi:hypothetical protein